MHQVVQLEYDSQLSTNIIFSYYIYHLDLTKVCITAQSGDPICEQNVIKGIIIIITLAEEVMLFF